MIASAHNFRCVLHDDEDGTSLALTGPTWVATCGIGTSAGWDDWGTYGIPIPNEWPCTWPTPQGTIHADEWETLINDDDALLLQMERAAKVAEWIRAQQDKLEWIEVDPPEYIDPLVREVLNEIGRMARPPPS